MGNIPKLQLIRRLYLLPVYRNRGSEVFFER